MHTYTHIKLVFLMSMWAEDGCHSIMLMSMSAVQSHASLTERQAEDTDGEKKRKMK